MVDEAGHAASEILQAGWDERPFGDTPQAGVLRRVGRDHGGPAPSTFDHAEPVLGDSVPAHGNACALAAVGMTEDLPAGGEARGIPDPVERAAVQRCELPQGVVEGVGVGLALGSGEEAVEHLVGPLASGRVMPRHRHRRSS